jgi:hypothetical protein
MRLSITVVATTTLSSFAIAHSGFGLPQIQSHDQRINALLASFRTGTFGIDSHVESALKARASAKECGEGIGSCPEDRGCCSTAGCT